MRGFCWDEQEHEDKAKDDARWHHRDYEYYDRYSDDPCKQVYTETYDREIRAQERREEAQIEEEQEEVRAMRRRQMEREVEENCQFYEEQYPEPQYPEEPVIEGDAQEPRE